MIRYSFLAAMLCSSFGASAQDAAQTDGDKYKVVLENTQIRVLEYRDLPGERRTCTNTRNLWWSPWHRSAASCICRTAES